MLLATSMLRQTEGLRVTSRRSVLKAGLAGMAGLSLADLLRLRSQAADSGKSMPAGKSVILLWMTGGPSHIDTWDVKPDAPREIRGPFSAIRTKLPGVQLCEYLPRQAAMMDKLTIIRSVDARFSNHEPNQVFQTANLAAEPRLNSEAEKYPAIASIVARHRATVHPSMPPSVVLNLQDRSHVAWGGYLGKQFDPFLGNQASSLFKLPRGLDQDRIASRQTLQQQFDRLRRDLDLSGSMAAKDRFDQQAIDIVAGRKAQAVFDLCARTARHSRPLWKPQLVPASVARPPAGRGRCELRHHRSEQSRLLGHVGYARRQHSAVRRNLERPASLAAGVRPSAHYARGRSGRARAARRRAGDRHGRIRSHAQDGHARQHRWPRSLAGRHVDDVGRRRYAPRPGYRRPASATAARSRSDPSRRATWRPRSTTTWACRWMALISTPAAARATSSSKANRFAS